MEDLTLNNLMSSEEIDSLFANSEVTETEESSTDKGDNNDQNNDTTEKPVDINNLFASESVGSEENYKEQEDTITDKGDGTSPNNFYSSIAKALKEDGVFPDLEDDKIDTVKEAEDFARLMKEHVESMMDEKQRRYEEARNANLEDSVINSYERTLKYLNDITDEKLQEDSKEGTALRRQIIYQDLLNKGYEKDEALEELQDIFDNGLDNKRATKALASNKVFFSKNYQKAIDEAKEEAAKEEKRLQQQAAELKKSILEDTKVFGELEIDKATRQKIFDTVSKPVYHDKETDEYFTALQRYEKENPVEFRKNVGLFFTLTNGFKNLDNLIQPKLKKEVKKNLRELEHKINNTSRSSDGNLRFVSGVDEESSARKWELDI